ncbi:AraC family transcriptional regulator [Paractinoplanes lichenicola]|uniref:AraC family transcriptional regulator n=1 Tax=Paractinoplanes lichenicola TaxID=2802976 RepID=A0ABS1VZM1_9ACTN|nr:AraC family transcriptional regulator [Actinoplanes lichenicola]MBL7259900.1 AraC family transcriptional regulator [Actinoplanes lichenicola]
MTGPRTREGIAMPDGPVRSEVLTTDQDAAVEAMMRIAVHRPRVQVIDPAAVGFSVRSAGLPEWGTERVTFTGIRYGSVLEPSSSLIAGVWRGGHGVLRMGPEEVAMGAGDAFIYPIGRTLHFDNVEPDKTLVRLPPAYVAGVAEELTGLPAADLHFLSARPLTESKRANWSATSEFLADHLHDPGREIPPLLAEQMMRLTATALLRVFPNTTMTVARVPSGGRSSPAVVRRATDFMDANAGRPLTVAEIAAAAEVGPRALQAAFRRHAMVAPLAYLRRVRLERARADLRDASPGDGTTVAAIAGRWGFHRADRFAAAYRDAFGEPPRVG